LGGSYSANQEQMLRELKNLNSNNDENCNINLMSPNFPKPLKTNKRKSFKGASLIEEKPVKKLNFALLNDE
jgi:hypothetical protein